MASRLQKMQQSRSEKLKVWQEKGNTGFEQKCNRTHLAEQALKNDGQEVTVAGRIMGWRGHGKLQFADLVDASGKIQLAFKADVVNSEAFENLSLLDTGDIIEASGTTFTTNAGERTVEVRTYRLLSKALRPLPSKWHGLKDVEERYRQRYVDLILNEQVRSVFETRTKVVTLLRKFFDERGFLEVETPVLQPIYGGATAKPFTTHHNALGHDFYLRIADELYLKRLIVGGFEKVYEIGHDFRNEGLSRSHNPEFTQIEFYWAYATYEDLMVLTEELLEFIIKELTGGLKLTYKGQELNFERPWKRVSYREVLLEHAGLDIEKVTNYDDLMKFVKERQIRLDLKRSDGLCSTIRYFIQKIGAAKIGGTTIFD